MAPPVRLHSRLTSIESRREYAALRQLSDCPQILNLSLKSRRKPSDEFSALNALIQDREACWSIKARAIKFDIEFKAIEQERRRVAKELHDEILPSLSRLIRSVESQGISANTEPLTAAVRETIAAFRDLLGELHPVDLEELGLVPALSNICKRYARMTGRAIVFAHEMEDCGLSDLQQLCLYRALQSTLSMFANSENDILLVSYDCVGEESIITARCIDRRVSSADWLSSDSPEFSAFETWCAMAGAECKIGDNYRGDFPCDLFISVSNSARAPHDASCLIGELAQVRLDELDSIIALAQAEWIQLINRDCSLFKKLAVEVERKRISEEINRVILPHLDCIKRLADASKIKAVRLDVHERMSVIESGVNEVMSELHPRLLAEAGLFPSIRTLVDRFKHASLIETTIISNMWSDEIDEIALESKFAIYRVVQEALNNIEKHSGATRALITIIFNAGELLVLIEDNGKGFKGCKSTLSRGLRNIHERAREIGARVSWDESASFKTGTLVTISLRCLNLDGATT